MRKLLLLCILPLMAFGGSLNLSEMNAPMYCKIWAYCRESRPDKALQLCDEMLKSKFIRYR